MRIGCCGVRGPLSVACTHNVRGVLCVCVCVCVCVCECVWAVPLWWRHAAPRQRHGPTGPRPRPSGQLCLPPRGPVSASAPTRPYRRPRTQAVLERVDNVHAVAPHRQGAAAHVRRALAACPSSCGSRSRRSGGRCGVHRHGALIVGGCGRRRAAVLRHPHVGRQQRARRVLARVPDLGPLGPHVQYQRRHLVCTQAPRQCCQRLAFTQACSHRQTHTRAATCTS
jgi:hypothetical protein